MILNLKDLCIQLRIEIIIGVDFNCRLKQDPSFTNKYPPFRFAYLLLNELMPFFAYKTNRIQR